MEIRKAKISDLSAIQKLNAELCAKEHTEYDVAINVIYPHTPHGKKYFSERITTGCAIVAIDNKKIIGYLVGGLSPAPAYLTIKRVAELENMFILKQYRGQGIGKRLVQEFIKCCKAKKIERIIVIASAQNSGAITFYEREGFCKQTVGLKRDL